MRKIKVKNGDKWLTISFENLKVGDVFSIYDNGLLFIDAYYRSEWTVRTPPKKNSDGIYYVEVEEDTE